MTQIIRLVDQIFSPSKNIASFSKQDVGEKRGDLHFFNLRPELRWLPKTPYYQSEDYKKDSLVLETEHIRLSRTKIENTDRKETTATSAYFTNVALNFADLSAVALHYLFAIPRLLFVAVNVVNPLVWIAAFALHRKRKNAEGEEREGPKEREERKEREGRGQFFLNSPLFEALKGLNAAIKYPVLWLGYGLGAAAGFVVSLVPVFWGPYAIWQRRKGGSEDPYEFVVDSRQGFDQEKGLGGRPDYYGEQEDLQQNYGQQQQGSAEQDPHAAPQPGFRTDQSAFRTGQSDFDTGDRRDERKDDQDALRHGHGHGY